MYPEEQVLLGEFSRITGMKITDMGEFDSVAAQKVADTIAAEEFTSPIEAKERTAWMCPVCGYTHYGDEPPEVCSKCKTPGECFIKK